MLPVVLSQNNTLPVLEGQEQFATEMFSSAFSGFFSSYRYLRPKKMDFHITSGGAAQVVPNGDVIGVLLGVSPYNHCTWYERKFQPGMEPEQPDLVWLQKTADTFPDALPVQFRKKVNIGGYERWDFRVARRTVWALLQKTPDGQVMLDLDNPVIFDMTSASMFGKSDPRTNSYKWTGLKQFCDQYSTAIAKCNPLMFCTQIAIDPDSPVPGVVVFRPQMGQNGPVFLDHQMYSAVVEKAKSSTVSDMLTVQEILDYTPRGGSQTPPVQTATAPAQPAAPAAPAAPQAPTQLPDDKPAATENLLHQAQAVLNNVKPSEEAAAPVQPEPITAQARPKVSAAASEGIANIMGSLGDF